MNTQIILMNCDMNTQIFIIFFIACNIEYQNIKIKKKTIISCVLQSYLKNIAKETFTRNELISQLTCVVSLYALKFKSISLVRQKYFTLLKKFSVNK